MQQLTTEQEQEVVEAYKLGEPLKKIEDRYDIPRSTLYWVLQKHEVVANRVNKTARLTGNDHVLADLYEIIEAQRTRIEELERQLRNR